MHAGWWPWAFEAGCITRKWYFCVNSWLKCVFATVSLAGISNQTIEDIQDKYYYLRM